jgi:flagellar motility protein MotE (MotC chaperone)
MDPELAGQKISKFTDPKEAAYIIYNMKERKAGAVMNYIDPEVVDKIVKILTDIKLKGKRTTNSP